MKKYLKTFRGKTDAQIIRKVGFVMFVILFTALNYFYLSALHVDDNNFVVFLMSLAFGFMSTLFIDLFAGVGRTSPIVDSVTNKLNKNKQGEVSDETIFNLAMHQNNPMFHPYTCDRRAKECEVNQIPRDFSKDGVLIPTKKGWVCPCGKYTQKI